MEPPDGEKMPDPPELCCPDCGGLIKEHSALAALNMSSNEDQTSIAFVWKDFSPPPPPPKPPSANTAMMATSLSLLSYSF
jgi:hypothetical protein